MRSRQRATSSSGYIKDSPGSQNPGYRLDQHHHLIHDATGSGAASPTYGYQGVPPGYHGNGGGNNGYGSSRPSSAAQRRVNSEGELLASSGYDHSGMNYGPGKMIIFGVEKLVIFIFWMFFKKLIFLVKLVILVLKFWLYLDSFRIFFKSKISIFWLKRKKNWLFGNWTILVNFKFLSFGDWIFNFWSLVDL